MQQQITDFTLARQTMVESQLRTTGVTDRALLAAMSTVPREIFLAPESRSLAYMDGALPIRAASDDVPYTGRRYLMPPMTLARLIQLAEIGAAECILDVGCATGYSVAVLAVFGGFVVGLESDPQLAEQAESNLLILGIPNAKIVTGELSAGAAADGPYDLIFLDGSVPAISADLIAQIKEGGRIAGIISSQNQCMAHLFVKTGGELGGVPQFTADAKPLPGFARLPSFSF